MPWQHQRGGVHNCNEPAKPLQVAATQGTTLVRASSTSGGQSVTVPPWPAAVLALRCVGCGVCSVLLLFDSISSSPHNQPIHHPRRRFASTLTFWSKVLEVMRVVGVWKGLSITCGVCVWGEAWQLSHVAR